MPTKKGRTGPNIGSHGKAIAVSDVNSSLSKPYDIGSTFKPDPSDIKNDGAKTFKFPLDDVSGGNFWTRLVINSWVPVAKGEGMINGQHFGLDKDSIANIWLPMPLTLGTTYAQTYADADHMTVSEGSNDVGTEQGGVEGTTSQALGILSGMMNEFQSWGSNLSNVNSSGKMAKGSVQNQKLGLVYDGAALRTHSLGWRMTPKDRAEQKAIQQVCFAFKKFSSPIVKGPLGGEITVNNSNDAHAQQVADIEAAGENTSDVAGGGDLLDQLGDSMANIGRLGIPVTVNVEFWYGAKINTHLFQIKDSFITSVNVNYTPTGTWNAYEDGAPIETLLTVELKENAVVTANDIQQVGGY